METILICDDDKEIVEAIEIYLKNEGYNVCKAYNGEDALKALSENEIHLIIMDIMMPKLDGLHATMKIRENYGIPIIMLSAKSEDTDKILGLNVGADDYVTKPFSPSELMARVDAIYRRVEMSKETSGAKEQDDTVILGEFVLNPRNRTLTKSGHFIDLTQVEFQIMECFFQNPGAALDRTDILNRVWGSSYFGEEKIVDVNIRRLRMKIEDEPSNPKHLVTIWGLGYKWVV